MLEVLKDAEFEMPEAPIDGKLLRKGDVPPKYLADRDANRRNVETYLNESRRRLAAGDPAGAIRVLSSVIEEYPSRGDALRLVGYRLLDLGQPAQAVRLFDRVQRQRPFEPHSYLDLARSLEQSGKFGLAAVHYEIALAGTWHPRFHGSLKDVAREDYGRMMRQAIHDRKVSDALADHFGERLEKMDPKKLQSDLRVSMSWNTDGTDIDLWVIEPDGTKCFYSHNRTKNGGELSQDMTQGYGPERYQMKKAIAGEFKIVAHYFRANPNLLGGETHVNVTVTRFAGTPQEVVERHTVILKKQGQEAPVCTVKF
jgi:tetratricopeptide (TPR) repeat protein